MAQDLSVLVAELGRRRVFRVGFLYLVAGWVAIQVADTVLPRLALPDWTVTLVIVLVALGLPVALALAWAFDVTPAGVRRTPPLSPDAASLSRTPSSGLARRVAIAGAVVVLALAGMSFVALRDRGPDMPAERVVVARFENRTGDAALEPLGAMAADWITQGLAREDFIEAVPVTTALPSSDHTAREGGSDLELARALGERTAAGTVVTGAYYLQAGTVRFQAQIHDARGRRLLRAIDPVTASLDDPMPAVESLRQATVGAVAYHLHPNRLGAIGRATPPSYDAYRAYVQGVETFMRTAGTGAAADLRRAIEADSGFLPAYAFLSTVYFNEGRLAAMDSLLRVTRARRDDMDPAMRLNLEVDEAQLTGDHMAGLRAVRRMHDLSRDWAYLHGWQAVRANRPREAVKAFRSADVERGWARDWWAHWSQLAFAYHLLGEHRRELNTLREGLRVHPGTVAMLRGEARALAALGRIDEARTVIDALVASGDRVPSALNSLALELRWHDQPAIADDVHRVALEHARTAVQHAGAGAAAHTNLALTLYALGEYDEAHNIYERLVAEQPTSLARVGRSGTIAVRRGDTAEANRIAALLEAWDEPYTRGANHTWLARMAAIRGDRAAAMDHLRRGIAAGVTHSSLHSDMDLVVLLDHPPFRELMRPQG